MSSTEDYYLQTHSKSYAAGFFLTVVFGPLGLFYCNWIAALILSVVAIAFSPTIIVPILCWLLSIAMTYPAVHDYNERLKATAKLNRH